MGCQGCDLVGWRFLKIRSRFCNDENGMSTCWNYFKKENISEVKFFSFEVLYTFLTQYVIFYNKIARMSLVIVMLKNVRIFFLSGHYSFDQYIHMKLNISVICKIRYICSPVYAIHSTQVWLQFLSFKWLLYQL